MPTRDMKPFRLKGSYAVFRPRYEHFGDAAGPGDLMVGWDSDGTLSEGDRVEVIEFCRKASGNFPTFADAQSHLHRCMYSFMSTEDA